LVHPLRHHHSVGPLVVHLHRHRVVHLER
jgi:hypothetical protein